MVSEQVTKDCKIFKVMDMMSGSLVFKAAIERLRRTVYTFNGDDELRDDGEDLSTTLLQHVEDALDSQESVWVLLLTDTLEEDWQVMMIIELLNLHLPVNPILRAMLDGNG